MKQITLGDDNELNSPRDFPYQNVGSAVYINPTKVQESYIKACQNLLTTLGADSKEFN